MEAWGSFFIAQVGASAALTGLVFVSVSLNLTKVLDPTSADTRLSSPDGPAEILIISSLAIVPQPLRWLGGEACCLRSDLALVVNFDYRTLIIAGKEYRRRSVHALSSSQVAATAVRYRCGRHPYPRRRRHVLARTRRDLHYLIALLDAWVLLVEINR